MWLRRGAQQETPDFLQASVIHAELGVDQLDKGWISAGVKYLKWKNTRFTSSNLYYGYNPWTSLHGARVQFDYTIYFPSVGISSQVVTNGEQSNVSIRPQLGLFFIYANLYVGYNFWMGNQLTEDLNNWTISAYFSLPLKRW